MRWFAAVAVVLLLVMMAPIIATLAAVPPSAAVHAFAQLPAQSALRVSLAASSIALAIASVLGVPGGYALAHAPRGLRAAMLALLALPLAFPPVASGIMLLQTVGTRTAFGAALAAHGMVLVDSFGGVVLAEFFVAGSFVAITAAAAFGSIDPVFEETARTLGAGTWTLFLRIALPVAAPNVAAGILLGWMRAIGEYGATSLLSYHPMSLPIEMYVALSAQGVRTAVALSYGFIVLAALVVAAQWAVRRRVV